MNADTFRHLWAKQESERLTRLEAIRADLPPAPLVCCCCGDAHNVFSCPHFHDDATPGLWQGFPIARPHSHPEGRHQ